MNLTIPNLIVISLALWRVSSLVANELGPFYMFFKLRQNVKRLERRNRLCKAFHLHEMLECEWCNSIWFGIIFSVLWVILGDIFILYVLPLTLSTLVIAIKHAMQHLMENHKQKGGEQHANENSLGQHPVRG